MPDDPHFESIEILPGERQVLVGGRPAPLGARAFDLLMALYERRDRVVTKNELLDLVWPGLVVEENNLQVQVSSLRKVLGPRAIATIPGRGYRYTLPAAPAAEHPAVQDRGPAAALQPAGNNLPAPAPLFGRDQELREAGALMAQCRVVSIVGAGGIGKTRLALALAGGDRHPARDGRWWVELAPINEGSQIPTAVANALGLQLPVGSAPQEALVEVLAKREALLVLDNCEHLAEAVAALVAQVRERAPGVRLLITTQESLKCVDEQIYRLGSLALPDAADLGDVELASRCGAVALFVARARAVDPRFQLSADNLSEVVDICRRLDGIALAIELAAARVPALGVTGLRTRLDHMFSVLTGVSRMKLRRHQTLRAALEWSCNLLSEDERVVFRRLGVFAGGFTLELAQALASDAALDEWRVLDALSQLIDRSLVIAEGEGEPRYRLLEPTRAYALESLAAQGESAATLQRHAEVMLQFLVEHEAARWTLPYRQRMRHLAELGNLRAALDWAESPAGDRDLARRLLARSSFIWVGNDAAAEGYERMARHWPVPAGTSQEDEAALALAIPNLRCFMARDLVRQAAQRAAELYRALGDRSRLADALVRVAQCAMRAKDELALDAAVLEAAALIGQSAPPRQRGLLAMLQGSIAIHRGNWDEAAAGFRHQAELYALDDDSGIGQCLALSNLANVYLDTGRLDEAIDACRQSLAGLHRAGALSGIGMNRAHLAIALAIRGDEVDVPALAREAYEFLRSTGLHFKPLFAAALHHARHGDAARAGLVFGQARQLMHAEGSEPCLFDMRLRTEFESLMRPHAQGAALQALEHAGTRLSAEQIAALAFEAAPVDPALVCDALPAALAAPTSRARRAVA